MTEVVALREAVAGLVSEGDSVTLEGFTHLIPSAAAHKIIRQEKRDLNCVLIYESGTIGAKPDVLPLSIGDGVPAEYADSVVSVPEIFNYWLQAGRVDVGLLGAAQMDRYGNINTTVIGPYESRKVRFPAQAVLPRSRLRRGRWS